MERMTLATSSVIDLQEAKTNSPNFRCIPSETTILASSVLEVGPMLPLWCHDLQNKLVEALQLVEFLDAKMAG